PRLSAQELEAEIRERIRQLRRHRLREEIGEVERLLRDAADEGDVETGVIYRSRAQALLEKLAPIEKERAEPRNWRDRRTRLIRQHAATRRQAGLPLFAGDVPNEGGEPDAISVTQRVDN